MNSQETKVEGSAKRHLLKEYDVATNRITLHVTEQGEGPAVLFCTDFQILPTHGARR